MVHIMENVHFAVKGIYDAASLWFISMNHWLLSILLKIIYSVKVGQCLLLTELVVLMMQFYCYISFYFYSQDKLL